MVRQLKVKKLILITGDHPDRGKVFELARATKDPDCLSFPTPTSGDRCLMKATENEFLPQNPSAKLKPPKFKDAIAERILTEDEWRKLLYAEPNRQHQLMLQLLYETRARVSEFCSLKWRDIREKADGAALVTLFGKGNKTRKVTITPELWQILKTTKPVSAKGDDPLPGEYGAQYTLKP